MNVALPFAGLLAMALLGPISSQISIVKTANGAGQRVEGVEEEKCPVACPLNGAPMCGAKWYDRFLTFPNDCVRRYRNCHTGETFEFVCNGTCVFENNRAMAIPKQCAPLQPAALCKQ